LSFFEVDGAAMTTNSGNFDSINNIFDKNAIYVIPIFQRPYAWENKQLSDLINDIYTCCNRSNPYHYLSPIHLIKVDSPDDPVWYNYTDKDNSDIDYLSQSGFVNDDGGTCSVYFVVDGQQRLTTLFTLLHLCTTNSSRLLTVTCNGRYIPKIILNPADDHQYFRNLLNLPDGYQSIKSKSQERLDFLFDRFSREAFEPNHYKFIKGPQHVCLLITLEQHHGLQTFLTLNDRGKDLTTFEKLKSLFMEYDMTCCSPSSPLNIHKLFAKSYKTLDRIDCYINEDQFVQLAAINIWIAEDGDIAYKGAESIYDTCFRKSSFSADNSTNLHGKWIPAFSSVIDKVDELTSILDASDIIRGQASIIVPCRQVGDDYDIVFKSLGLSIRGLAVLLKLRQEFNCDWHSPICTVTQNNKSIKDALTRSLNSVIGEITGTEDSENLLDFGSNLKHKISLIYDSEQRELSCLQLAEMMELFVFKMGSTKPGTYSSIWKASFDNNSDSQRAGQEWFYYITSYGSREGFFNYLLESSPDSRDPLFKYILREYDFCINGQNTHFNDNLALEHIFPHSFKAISPSLSDYGFVLDNEIEYQRFTEMLGNKVMLSAKLNDSIKEQMPRVKGIAYREQRYVTTDVPVSDLTHSSVAVGKMFEKVKNALHYKHFLLLRRIDLVLFAASRF